MRKRIIVGFAAAGLLAIGGPAWADTASGSHETHEECTTDPDTGETTCTTVADNDVKCGAGQTAPTPAGSVTVSPSGSPATRSGELEVCSADGPVQGRIILNGTAGPDGGSVAADGDTDNAEQAQGWARVDVGSDGVTIRCGDPEGDGDSTEPTENDGREDCG